jgi:tripartite-type tricarboxylate transporter receptor subunit TctC
VGFDPNKDFVPAGLLGSLVMALGVSSTEPVKSIDELIAAAKARPGQLNYGSFGTSSPQNLAMHSFLHNRSLSMVQVAYKGGSQAMTDLISGRIAAMVSAVNQLIPLSQGGKVRILAIGGDRRLPVIPDVPTTREIGLTEIDNLWMAMLAPAGTPAQYVTRVNNEVNAILALPEIQEALAKQGITASTSGPAELAAFLKKDTEYWRKLVATAGVVPE